MRREKPIVPRPVRDKVPMGMVRKTLKEGMDEVHIDPPGPLGFTRYLDEDEEN